MGFLNGSDMLKIIRSPTHHQSMFGDGNHYVTTIKAALDFVFGNATNRIRVVFGGELIMSLSPDQISDGSVWSLFILRNSAMRFPPYTFEHGLFLHLLNFTFSVPTQHWCERSTSFSLFFVKLFALSAYLKFQKLLHIQHFGRVHKEPQNSLQKLRFDRTLISIELDLLS